MTHYINYAELLDDAMYGVVHKVLHKVSKEGLKEGHYFYISFDTRHPNVIISRHLIEQHPYEMTIVVQYQYHDLIVKDEYFEIILLFDNKPERISIPIRAIVSFIDPSIQFGLKFKSKIKFDKEEKKENSLFKESTHKQKTSKILDIHDFQG